MAPHDTVADPPPKIESSGPTPSGRPHRREPLPGDSASNAIPPTDSPAYKALRERLGMAAHEFVGLYKPNGD